MSERPGGSIQPSISAGHGVQPSVGIGSYKGVMLCNRPFAGAAVGAQGQSAQGAGEGAFNCGIVPKKAGANVPISNKEKVLQRKKSKKDSALSRHKKWLNDLQKTKERLESEYLTEADRKEKSRKAFMENQAKMRSLVRGELQQAQAAGQRAAEGKADSPRGGGAKGAKGDADGDEDLDMEDFDLGEFEGPGGGGADEKRGGGGEEKRGASSAKASARRPAWALTEGAAAAAAEEQEAAEVADLLAFTKDLDFDKYIHDMELQTMIDQVMKRIRELEALGDEAEVDEAGLEEELSRQRSELSRLTGHNLRRLDRETRGDKEEEVPERDEDEDIRSLARSVLSEGKMSVHSQRSARELAARARDKFKAEMAAVPEGQGLKIQPKVISHVEDKFENKNQISNLPYMHRNPAI